jgi:hypothetical protein
MDTAPVFTKTSDLDKQFNIGKNTRINRLAMLGLTPDKLRKEGKFYLLTPEQVALFTDLDKHILNTGSPDGYPGLYRSEPEEQPEAIEDDSLPEFLRDLPMERPASREPLNVPFPLDEEIDIQPAPSTSNLARTAVPQLAAPPEVEAEYDDDYAHDIYQVNSTTQLLVNNAQRRAAALMMAEHALVEQYMNDPTLLNPDLLAQIGSVQYREVDPKELAASLIAGARSAINGAA